MGYRIGIEDGTAGCDGAARNARAWHGTEGMKASTTKTTAPTTETSNGMKATALKTASGMKASATMETAPAPDASRLGEVCERQPHECARQDPSEYQRNPLAVHSSQHVFLHLN